MSNFCCGRSNLSSRAGLLEEVLKYGVYDLGLERQAELHAKCYCQREGGRESDSVNPSTHILQLPVCLPVVCGGGWGGCFNEKFSTSLCLIFLHPVFVSRVNHRISVISSPC